MSGQLLLRILLQAEQLADPSLQKALVANSATFTLHHPIEHGQTPYIPR